MAIKVLADNWSGDLSVRERFLSEAKILRRVSDPRVVKVHDLGTLADGRPYFVMDYTDGGTVADLMAGGITLRQALWIGAETARGLQALHEHGVVHRDIKPSNLLLDSLPDGSQRVVIADLGMAKSLAEASGLTMAAGTPAYMAPEQVMGGEGFDQRADVYGAAAVTYTLLAGEPPFDTSEGIMGVARRDKNLAPRPLPTDREIPRELERLLGTALAYEPARRPATAATFADQLSGIRDRLPDGDTVVHDRPHHDENAWTPRALTAMGAATFAVCALATWLTLFLLGR